MTGFVPVILEMLAFAKVLDRTTQDTYIEDLYEALPLICPLATSVLPDYQVDIRDFGAKADGETLNTEAINNAIRR